MKFYLLLIIFLFFVLVGIYLYCRYYFRYLLFKDLTFICKYLKNNISFKKDNVDTLIKNASDSISIVGKMLLKNPKNNNLIIKKQDIVLVKDFINSLGKGDVSYEINNLNYYESNFDENRQVTKELFEKNGYMYIKLMIGLGLAICIMLI